MDHRIRSPEELVRHFGCTLPKPLQESDRSITGPMWLTPYFAGLIDPNDPGDPILRQILPYQENISTDPDTSPDPLAEAAHSPLHGLVHRYPDRVLLTPNGYCAVLCRFCMRRRAWSDHRIDSGFSLSAAIDYIDEHKEIREVILSGGDPLLLPLDRLGELLDRLHTIPHIRLIRIGSRVPSTLPMRIDDPLLDLLAAFKPLWLITHFNHPRELSNPALAGLSRLAEAGVLLNNQSVLLKGVNDRTATLIELSSRLLSAGVRPYYLHQVDSVIGADRFRVSLERGMNLVQGMFGRISGLGIPRYTLDLPGGKGKIPLTPSFQSEHGIGFRVFKAPLGGWVRIRE
ncbi:MAG: KamA family radical SAM protein [Planctomycetes bacterium]|nr:KamA family radical SAM protein [Planctomycetota bacterium]